jgi:flagellum-specific ATP synthase
VLSRRLAQRGHYPAIDVLKSISRLAKTVTGPQTQAASRYIKKLMAVYAESEDLINVGAYVRGSSKEIDEAIDKITSINEFLNQGISEKNTVEELFSQMGKISNIPVPAEEYANEKIPV